MTRLCGTIPYAHIFRDTNCWRRNVYADPLCPDSDALIAAIEKYAQPEPWLWAFGGTVEGQCYCTVRGTQPLVPVTFNEYPGEECWEGGYPIPSAARTVPWYINSGVPGGGPTGDRAMNILDVDNGLLYEIWYLRWNAVAQRWEAGAGRRYDVNDTDETGHFSANYSGLSTFAGLLRYDEVYQRSAPIEHALRGVVRWVSGAIPPARHDGEHGAPTDSPPAGLRLRLKPDYDLSDFKPEVAKVLTALKQYGIILTDSCGYQRLILSSTHDARWREDWWMQHDFQRVPISAFECVA